MRRHIPAGSFATYPPAGDLFTIGPRRIDCPVPGRFDFGRPGAAWLTFGGPYAG